MMDTSTEPEIVMPGDRVLVILDKRRRYIVEARRGVVLHTDRGVLSMDDVLDRPYGSRVEMRGGQYAYILRPLPEDLMLLGFKRRSQVIYPKDLGYIILLSGVKPGSRVVEAGVGSGFLTFMLAYLVGDNGIVYGFDVREDMIKTARSNLMMAGLLSRVQLAVHDVRKGFPVQNTVDAVFLDLPDPWNTVGHVYSVLKASGRVIVFQPTVNQVEKTASALKRHGGFTDIRAVEILLREYIVEEGRVRPHTRMIGHTGFIVHARKVLIEGGEKK